MIQLHACAGAPLGAIGDAQVLRLSVRHCCLYAVVGLTRCVNYANSTLVVTMLFVISGPRRLNNHRCFFGHPYTYTREPAVQNRCTYACGTASVASGIQDGARSMVYSGQETQAPEEGEFNGPPQMHSNVRQELSSQRSAQDRQIATHHLRAAGLRQRPRSNLVHSAT